MSHCVHCMMVSNTWKGCECMHSNTFIYLYTAAQSHAYACNISKMIFLVYEINFWESLGQSPRKKKRIRKKNPEIQNMFWVYYFNLWPIFLPVGQGSSTPRLRPVWVTVCKCMKLPSCVMATCTPMPATHRKLSPLPPTQPARPPSQKGLGPLL